jgi:hypothetical protein
MLCSKKIKWLSRNSTPTTVLYSISPEFERLVPICDFNLSNNDKSVFYHNGEIFASKGNDFGPIDIYQFNMNYDRNYSFEKRNNIGDNACPLLEPYKKKSFRVESFSTTTNGKDRIFGVFFFEDKSVKDKIERLCTLVRYTAVEREVRLLQPRERDACRQRRSRLPER